MKRDPNILAVWENLPDPLPADAPDASINIMVPERMWRKFVGKHVCSSREPWSDVFGESAAKTLMATPEGPFSEGPVAEASEQALATLESEVRRSLSLPLTLVYTSLRERGIDGERWVIPLQSGAIAVVHVGAEEKTLKTCYFTGAAGVDLRGAPNRRWKTALKQLVFDHTDADPVSQRRRLPDRRQRREKSVLGQQAEMCVNIRFVDPQVWGFAGSAAGSEWATPTWTWPEAR
jgi:hypothetical protein